MNNFGSLLNALRIKKGWSVEQLADALYESITTVNNWELGLSYPTKSQLESLILIFPELEKYRMYYLNSDFGDTVFSGDNNNQSFDGFQIKDIRFRDLFKNTFKRNKLKGYFDTKKYDNTIRFIGNNWVGPWFFLWFFIIFASLFGLATLTKIPWLVFPIGCAVVPCTLLMFFWEMNLYRNISIKRTIFIFIIGGIGSIILTLIIDAIVAQYNVALIMALTTGIIEELAKVIVGVYFLKKYNIYKILPAILIGAAVGAGFAVFESILYCFNALSSGGYDYALSTCLIRGITSIGSHTIWASISTSAFLYFNRGYSLNMNGLTNGKFIKVFIVPVLLHTMWNYSIYQFGSSLYFLMVIIHIAVIITGLFTVYKIIKLGLNEIKEY